MQADLHGISRIERNKSFQIKRMEIRRTPVLDVRDRLARTAPAACDKLSQVALENSDSLKVFS